MWSDLCTMHRLGKWTLELGQNNALCPVSGFAPQPVIIWLSTGSNSILKINNNRGYAVQILNL